MRAMKLRGFGWRLGENTGSPEGSPKGRRFCLAKSLFAHGAIDPVAVFLNIGLIATAINMVHASGALDEFGASEKLNMT